MSIGTPGVPDEGALVANLTAFQWFLDRAASDGIALTGAGFLKPADVEAACEVVPSVRDWIGKKNREDMTEPLLRFRISLQELGLLRKHKGRLLLTKAGKAVQSRPVALWHHLAASLVRGSAATFECQLRLLSLLYLASEPDGSPELVADRNAARALRTGAFVGREPGPALHGNLSASKRARSPTGECHERWATGVR